MGSEMCIRDRYQLFAIQNRTSFPIRKNHPEMGQAPTSQARPRYTDHVRPSNLAARTLSLVEHMLSKFGGDTYVACEARTHGSNEVLCANSTFFLVQAVNRNDPSLPTALLAGFSTMKGKPVLFSVLRPHNCRPQVLCAKNTFFSLAGQALERKKRSQSLVWVATPQRRIPVFVFCFPIP